MEEKQRQLEERGVAVEKALRGEAGTYLSLLRLLILIELHTPRARPWGVVMHFKCWDWGKSLEIFIPFVDVRVS